MLWQRNDVLSTYSPDSTKKVSTGFVNLDLPDPKLFEFLEAIGKSLAFEFKVLSPLEALKIKYGKGGSLTAPTAIPGMNGNVWRVVSERINDPNVQPILDKRIPSNIPRTAGLRAVHAQALAKKDVQYCDTIIENFLHSIARGIKSPSGMTHGLKSRFKTSRRSPGTPELPIMQTVTDLTSPIKDATVFSRKGDSVTPDPTLDFLASAFCRVLVDPATDTAISPEDDFMLSKTGAAAFYPHINKSAIPENYPISSRAAMSRRGVLGVVRYLAKFHINSFGSGQVLLNIFKTARPDLKIAILSVIYPWTHSNNTPLRQYRGRAVHVIDRAGFRVNANAVVHTIYLMDYLNTDQALKKHTISYLQWIKYKCGQAQSKVKAFAKLSSVFTPQVLVRTSPIVPLSVEVPATSIDQRQTQAEPEPEPAPEPEPTATVAKTDNNMLYVYIGSGVLVSAALGFLVYSKLKK